MYFLPTHPFYKANDPLGVCDEVETNDIIQADVLRVLLKQAKQAIQDSSSSAAKVFAGLVQDIVYCLHGNGRLNTIRLEKFLGEYKERDGLATALVNLIESALNLQAVIPSSELPYLFNHGDSVTFNGTVVNALLAHQGLGSPYQPKGNTWGLPCFISWYSSSATAHEQAVDGYLKTLLHHFQNPYENASSFSFYVHTAASMPNPGTCTTVPRFTVTIVPEIIEPSTSSPDTIPFILVAANNQPGPGPTGTQEERLQAASLALSLSSLITPVIPDDGAIITSPFPVHASWNGHNRSARLEDLYPPSDRPMRQYILADALPLDESERSPDGGLIDLQPENVEREVRKLYAAFSGASTYRKDQDSECIVEAPPWGCGAFGGDLVVKALCMMVAAGLAGVWVQLSVPGEKGVEARFVGDVLEKKHNVRELWQMLTGEKARESGVYSELVDIEMQKSEYLGRGN